jgi:hypothetical protein
MTFPVKKADREKLETKQLKRLIDEVKRFHAQEGWPRRALNKSKSALRRGSAQRKGLGYQR